MINTPLDFNFTEVGLSSYITDAISSLAGVWMIPAGLIIAAAVLSFALKMIKKFGRPGRTMPKYHDGKKPLYFSMMNQYHKGGK